MRKIVQFIGFGICVIIGLYIVRRLQLKDVSSLLQQNVDALAAVEQSDRMICYNEGSIDCNEVKAEFVIVGLRR